MVTYSFSAFVQKNVLKHLVDGTKFTIRTLNKQKYIYICTYIRARWKRITFYLSSCCVINDLTMPDSRAVSR